MTSYIAFFFQRKISATVPPSRLYKVPALGLLAEKIQLRDEKKQLRDKELILLNAKHHPTGINILDD